MFRMLFSADMEEMSLEQAEIEKRCGEIQVVFSEMYRDYYMLQVIENNNQAIKSGKYAYSSATRDSLEHIAILLKKDLGLNIWKIYYESAASSNSLSRLINVLNKERTNNGLPPIKRIKKDAVMNSVEKSLQKMRNTALAHLDFNRNNASIPISDLKHALDKALVDYNSACDALSLSKYKISNTMLGKIELITTIGFGQMIKGALVKLSVEQQGNSEETNE